MHVELVELAAARRGLAAQLVQEGAGLGLLFAEPGQAEQAQSTPMAWRHLPDIGGFGTALSGPTAFPSENVFTSVRVGKGHIDWHELTWEQNPTQFHIVNALAALPVLEYGPALVTEGSTNLAVVERPPRDIS